MKRFWDKLFGRSQAPHTSANTGQATPAAAPVTDTSARMTRLISLLCPPGADTAPLHAVVQLAATQPQAYFAQYEEALSQRGIETPERVSAWLALVDALAAHGWLEEFDWKGEAWNVAASLHALAGHRGAVLDTRQLAQIEGTHPLETFAAAMTAALAPAGLLAITLDIDSDSVPLVLVARAQWAEIEALAAALSQRVLIVAG